MRFVHNRCNNKALWLLFKILYRDEEVILVFISFWPKTDFIFYKFLAEIPFKLNK